MVLPDRENGERGEKAGGETHEQSEEEMARAHGSILTPYAESKR